MQELSEAGQLLASLIKIDSGNPDLVSGAAGESEIASFLESWFKTEGFECHRLEATPGRPSVVGIARGTGGGKSLMFNGHIDTVSLASYEGNPTDPIVRDGNMYGRGSFDMKGGIAAMMVAAKQVKAAGHAGDVIVACVADEEAASMGTEEVLKHFTADAGMIIEPSYLQVTMSHKGFVWFDVTIRGKAAHGSRPELGIDAIAKAGHFLVALEEYGRELALKSHPVMGPGTVHASLISGGEEASSYPAECRITIERRTVAGETLEAVQGELVQILERLERDVENFSWSLDTGLSRQPFQADPEAQISKVALAHITAGLGKPPVIRAEPFWTDCALLADAGIPCLLFGLDGDGAHAATEWITLESLETVTTVLTNIALDFCN